MKLLPMPTLTPLKTLLPAPARTRQATPINDLDFAAAIAAALRTLLAAPITPQRLRTTPLTTRLPRWPRRSWRMQRPPPPLINPCMRMRMPADHAEGAAVVHEAVAGGAVDAGAEDAHNAGEQDALDNSSAESSDDSGLHFGV